MLAVTEYPRGVSVDLPMCPIATTLFRVSGDRPMMAPRRISFTYRGTARCCSPRISQTTVEDFLGNSNQNILASVSGDRPMLASTTTSSGVSGDRPMLSTTDQSTHSWGYPRWLQSQQSSQCIGGSPDEGINNSLVGSIGGSPDT